MDSLISLAAAWATQHAILPHLGPVTKHSGLSDSPSLFALVIIAFVVRTLISLTRKLLFRRRAKALGCGDAPVYPHKDPILGLDILPETLHAFKSHKLLDLLRERFAKYGNTHWIQALGSWIVITCEPENIKTILGTKMDDWPVAGPRLYAALPLLGPKSVFTSNGKAWYVL